MSRESKNRIQTDSPLKPLAFNPFDTLSSEGLPSGPEIVPELSSEKSAPPSKKGRVVLRKETSHRAGKAVIVIGDFEPQISDDEIDVLSKEIKRKCGCGGAVKGREIEVQGDQPGRVREMLVAHGFRVAGIK